MYNTIMDFLTNRRIRGKVGSDISMKFHANNGIPQGRNQPGIIQHNDK